MKKGLRLTAACIAMLFILTMTGCGVNHKSPEGVVEALIKEYVAGSEKKVKSCYVQQDKEDDVLQKEITATLYPSFFIILTKSSNTIRAPVLDN